MNNPCNCEQALEYKQTIATLSRVIGEAYTHGDITESIGIQIQDFIDMKLKKWEGK